MRTQPRQEAPAVLDQIVEPVAVLLGRRKLGSAGTQQAADVLVVILGVLRVGVVLVADIIRLLPAGIGAGARTGMRD